MPVTTPQRDPKGGSSPRKASTMADEKPGRAGQKPAGRSSAGRAPKGLTDEERAATEEPLAALLERAVS